MRLIGDEDDLRVSVHVTWQAEIDSLYAFGVLGSTVSAKSAEVSGVVGGE